MSSILAEVTEDAGVRRRFEDAAWIDDYLRDGSPHGEPIYLSVGETWSQAPTGLARLLGEEMPSHVHGYIISQYGLPALQRVLRSYVPQTARIPDALTVGEDYEVAVACSGTRNSMYDFGCLIRENARGRPLVITYAPGWDYHGVFSGLDFQFKYLPLRAEEAFQPDPAHLERALRDLDAPADAIVVVNAQHNPTGINWSADRVRRILSAAADAGANILIDDAYFGVTDTGTQATSALRLLLEDHPRPPGRWLAVRSLGKQFNCNGWGIGAITASPDTVDRLVNDHMAHRSFTCAVPLQYAMAEWLKSAESASYLEQFRRTCTEHRALVADFLTRELHYPAESFHAGDCTSYLVFPVPPAYQEHADGVDRYRRDCFTETGVLLGAGTMTPEDPADQDVPDPFPFVRMFLAPPRDTVETALHRLRDAGFSWSRTC
ncbi:pyridoxal phosphate-dependent aminotransferase [Actinomadura hibisca]|uniref:pyridoxal phosphate-dependent aminotransferase n=1 Tax=Actinomadura hibisca TaxID=68565 RepID=UPI0008365B5B|nr:pyridoxal phosphate-dependent aminotransferase [Actinomadura hibisca]